MDQLYICNKSRTKSGRIKHNCKGCGHEILHDPIDDTDGGFCHQNKIDCGTNGGLVICLPERYQDTDRERFERFISSPPFERDVTRNSEDPTVSAWPGAYRDLGVDLAWEAFQEGAKKG